MLLAAPPQPARCDGPLDLPGALAARGSLLPLDALMQQACCAGGELATGGAGELPVRRKDVWPARHCGFVWSLVQPGYVRAQGHPRGRDDFPKSWDELRRLSKGFTVWKGDTLEVAGFIPWHAVEDLATWSASNGSQLYDAAQRKYTIDAEPNVAMMEYASTG